MTFVQTVPGRSPLSAPSGDVCVQMALEALRALAGPANSAADLAGVFLPPCAKVTQARRAFKAFRMAAQSHSGARAPSLAVWHAPTRTKDECRLLRALAAAQAGDMPLVDNYLFKLALDRGCRASLTEGVCSLAAALCKSGFLVPMLEVRRA